MTPVSRSRFTLAECILITSKIPEEDMVCLGMLDPQSIAKLMEVAPVRFRVQGFTSVPRRYERQARMVLRSLGLH
ncbi:hypothetical protein [Deinococcus cellulosilyticus]|uniref:Uncharacterized protein n=1 Tax=Deinococcus cellulosilyticus (strain DSM 18568 / NBRC 106333 / KACC 11606 / 5516J-15) TaxID=1223518 RepID=A0A511MZA7_DEIC1|nr:hypothetical protein [Deinococcus cellulosilyticus]GEM45934.1 hypothetical protein DC3_15690 [Deinococcus cellulosilyticus NBRC 106333 = KACC 11606]